jgi:hypothetical protein
MIDHSVRSPVAERARSTDHRRDGDRRAGLVLGAAMVAMALVAANILGTLLSTTAVAALARALFMFGRSATEERRSGELDG